MRVFTPMPSGSTLICKLNIHAAAAKVPALQRDPGEAICSNGRRGVDCKRQDFAEQRRRGLKALRDAGHALCAAVDLRLASGGLKI